MTTAKKVPRIGDLLTPAMIEYYQSRPVEFTEDIIFNKNAKVHGGKFEVTDQQKEVLNSVPNNSRTAVKAGRGVGKTGSLAFLLIWFHTLFPDARTAAFSPTFGQLQSVFWPEVAKWVRMSLVADCFEHTATKLYLRESPKTNFAEPRVANKPEAAQGLHAEHLLIIIDEASGVDDDIYEVLSGSLTGKNNRIIQMTNPTRTSGWSYDSHNRNKRFWNCITLSSEDSLIVDKDWLKEFKDKYVTPTFVHDMYKVHVLGLYPEGDPDSFMKLEDVELAKSRVGACKEGPIEIGVDVARKGDDMTVVGVRQGMYCYSGEELGLYPKKDTDTEHLITMEQTSKIPEIVSFVLDIVSRIRAITGVEDVIRIKVDDTGVGGGVTDYLELDELHNIEAVPIVFSMKRTDKYYDVTSRIYGNFRDLLPYVRIPNDRNLIEELATRRWDEDKGLIHLEPKKSFKLKYGSSPDRADALVLAFADIENEHRFIKAYDYKETVNRGKEAYTMLGGDKYCCIYAMPNQQASVVWASWFNGNLRIFDEFVGDTSEVLSAIKTSHVCNKIIGSPNMFALDADEMFLYFMDRGVFLEDAYGYNELAAINNLASIAKDKHLDIATECEKMSSQLRNWSSTSSKKDLKESYGLCYALTLVLNELVNNNSLIANEVSGRLHYSVGRVFSPIMDNTNFMSV